MTPTFAGRLEDRLASCPDDEAVTEAEHLEMQEEPAHLKRLGGS